MQAHDLAHFQGLHKIVGLLVQGTGIVALAADDQGGAGFVDEDGVDLVDNGEVVAALHHVLFVDHHVVAQVVEPELVVGAIGNVGIIGGVALFVGDALHDQAHGKAQPAVDLAHPLGVAAGQVVVHGDHMHALAGEGVQVNGQGGHQGFALAGAHLGDAGPVQHNAAQNLHGEMLHAQHPPAGLAADREGGGQDIVQAFAICQPLLEGGGHGLQLGVGLLLHLAFQRQNLVGQGADALELFFRERAEQFFHQ